MYGDGKTALYAAGIFWSGGQMDRMVFIRKGGVWQLPGGPVDFAETAICALKRQAEELLGVEVRMQGLPGRPIAMQEILVPRENERRVVVYYDGFIGGDPRRGRSEIGFFGKADIGGRLNPTFETDRSVLRDLFGWKAR